MFYFSRFYLKHTYFSRNMSFPTVWFVHTRSLESLEYYVTVKLLTEHHLEFLSLKGGCTGSSESTHVKMPHCWIHMSRLISVWPKKIIKIRSRSSVPGLKTMVLDLTGKMRFIFNTDKKTHAMYWQTSSVSIVSCFYTGKHWI